MHHSAVKINTNVPSRYALMAFPPKFFFICNLENNSFIGFISTYSVLPAAPQIEPAYKEKIKILIVLVQTAEFVSLTDGNIVKKRRLMLFVPFILTSATQATNRKWNFAFWPVLSQSQTILFLLIYYISVLITANTGKKMDLL